MISSAHSPLRQGQGPQHRGKQVVWQVEQARRLLAGLRGAHGSRGQGEEGSCALLRPGFGRSLSRYAGPPPQRRRPDMPCPASLVERIFNTAAADARRLHAC